MDNLSNERKLNSSNFADLSVDSILAEFRAEEEVDTITRGESDTHTSPIVMSGEEPTLEYARISNADFSNLEPIDIPTHPKLTFPNNETFFAPSTPIQDASVADDTTATCNARNAARYPVDTDATVVFEKIPSIGEKAIWPDDVGTQDRGGYAPNGNHKVPEAVDTESMGVVGRLKEKLLFPLLARLAAASGKRAEKRNAEKAHAEAQAAPLPPEMSPEKAARLYLDQAASIRLRCLFASFLSLVLAWLSYGLPAMGILGSSTYVRTMVCLILLLVTMLVGLDLLTNGFVSLFQKNPGPESLIAVSCLVSVVDAVYILVSGNTADGLPFCAVSALSLTFALWGSYLECKSFAISFRTAAIPKTPSVILSEDGGEEIGNVLVKVQRPVTGFVRKTEEADIFEKAFQLFSPLFLIVALVLSLFCFLASKDCNNLIHTFSAGISVCASFSAVFGFAYPFYVLTKRLARSGVAIAGYAGCADLGRISQIVIKDKDIFPVRTLSIANINVSEGFYPDKVVSCTASMVAAAGMGIAGIFTELMKKNGYNMQTVEDFACHEGGGILARINGDQIYVGSSSFMQLMGIRFQKGTGSNSAVYTAINDTLAGIFEVSYTPVTSVQKGLVTILRGKMEPVFAVRDFNITPLLIKQKFRLPKENYDFPSFADRYAISSSETEGHGSVVAMFSRGGLNAIAGVVKRGRALYAGLLLCAVVSVLGSFAGMLLMFSMCWGGIYASASCGNAMTFMLLWLVPVFVISLGLRR